MTDDTEREKIAAAIANARGGRRGMPPIKNVLDILPTKLKEEVLGDADAVIIALAQPAAGGAGGDEDPVDDLMARFSEALLAKIRAAGEKYGYGNAWLENDWRETLKLRLQQHVVKGDPLDVAAYCAFAWHHGWSITPTDTYRTAAPSQPMQLDDAAIDAALDEWYEHEDWKGTFRPSHIESSRVEMRAAINAAFSFNESRKS